MTERTTTLLTPAEIRILRFYKNLDEERFCRSLKTIAKACNVTPRTVTRANAHFFTLGILAWVSGNSASWRKEGSRGQANKYRLVLSGSGIEGFNVPQKTMRTLRSLIRKEGQTNQTNQTTHTPKLTKQTIITKLSILP